jgi:hypothetical protein
MIKPVFYLCIGVSEVVLAGAFFLFTAYYLISGLTLVRGLIVLPWLILIMYLGILHLRKGFRLLG